MTPSYNPDTASAAAYALGAAFPGESLAKQGAGYGAAAAFAPERALTEGQYALQSELASEAKAAGASSASVSKISPSVSHLLGYVADAQGNPIKDAKGKVIPVTTSGSGTTGKYHYMQPGDGFTYAFDPATGKTTRVGPGTTKGQGSSKGYQLKQPGDGSTYVFDPNSGGLKRIGPGPKKAPAGSTLSTSTRDTLSKEAQKWHDGTPAKGGTTTTVVKNNKFTTVRTGGSPAVKKIGYQAALRRLMTQRHLKLADAQDILDPVYAKGENGRPWADYQERKHLLSSGYPKALVQRLLTDGKAYNLFISLLPPGATILDLQRFTPAVRDLLKRNGLI